MIMRSEGAAHAFGLITRHGQAAVPHVPRSLDLFRRDLVVRKHPTWARMKRNFAPFSHERVRETRDLHEVRLVCLKGVVRLFQRLSYYGTHPVRPLSFPLPPEPCPALPCIQPVSHFSRLCTDLSWKSREEEKINPTSAARQQPPAASCLL